MRIPIRRKRSRYQKARDVLQEMLPRKRRKHHRSRSSARADASELKIPEHEHGFAGLHWMTAGLFVAAGAEAALGQRRGDHRPDDAVRWAPLVAAPIAGAAQAARAIWPSDSTRAVARIVNAAALAVGVAGLASSVRATLSEREYEPEEEPTLLERIPSLAPLAFGAVGLLGLLLDSEEEEAAVAAPAMPTRPRRGGEVKRIRIRV
jgi:hypothetical protein